MSIEQYFLNCVHDNPGSFPFILLQRRTPQICGRPFLSMLLLLMLVYFLLFQPCLKTLSIFISAKESTPHTPAGGPGVKDTFDLYVDGIDNIPDSSTIVKVYFNFVFSQEGGGREVHGSKCARFDQHHTTLLP